MYVKDYKPSKYKPLLCLECEGEEFEYDWDDDLLFLLSGDDATRETMRARLEESFHRFLLLHGMTDCPATDALRQLHKAGELN